MLTNKGIQKFTYHFLRLLRNRMALASREKRDRLISSNCHRNRPLYLCGTLSSFLLALVSDTGPVSHYKLARRCNQALLNRLLLGSWRRNFKNFSKKKSKFWKCWKIVDSKLETACSTLTAWPLRWTTLKGSSRPGISFSFTSESLFRMICRITAIIANFFAIICKPTVALLVLINQLL